MYDTPFHKQPINQQRFLVTGGAGFIGSNIVEYLLAFGAKEVRVLDNLSTGFERNIEPFRYKPNFSFIQGDIRDFETCAKACKGINAVCHQAALGSVPRSIKDPVATHEVNSTGYVNILRAADQAGIKKIVYASSSSVYGDEPTLPKKEGKEGTPLSPYAASKCTNELYGEVFSKTYGLSISGLRYFNIFGPRQDPNGPYAAVIPIFIDGLLKGKPVYINGDGTISRDFTYVENAVQANVLALTRHAEVGHEVYNIAVGERNTLIDLFNNLCELMGKDAKPHFREERPGDIPHSLADISRAKEILGYQPTVKFREGLERTIGYFRRENKTHG